MGARCGDVIRHVTGQRDHFAFNMPALSKHLIFNSYINRCAYLFKLLRDHYKQGTNMHFRSSFLRQLVTSG
jgi:hypothetical protein